MTADQEALVVGFAIAIVIVVGALLVLRYVDVSAALRYFGAGLLRLLRPFIPHLSLLCIVVGIIIAIARVIDVNDHNAALRQLYCERSTQELRAAGWKTLPCPKVTFPDDLVLHGDRSMWLPLTLGMYVCAFGFIVFAASVFDASENEKGE